MYQIFRFFSLYFIGLTSTMLFVILTSWGFNGFDTIRFLRTSPVIFTSLSLVLSVFVYYSCGVLENIKIKAKALDDIYNRKKVFLRYLANEYGNEEYEEEDVESFLETTWRVLGVFIKWFFLQLVFFVFNMIFTSNIGVEAGAGIFFFIVSFASIGIFIGIPLFIFRLLEWTEERVLTYTPLMSLLIILYSVPNIPYIIFALLLLCIRPRGTSISENIEECFEFENLKYYATLPTAILTVGVSTTASSNKLLSFILIIVTYLVCLVTVLVMTYQESKRDEEIKKEKQISNLCRIFARHKITEYSYTVICPSCSSYNILELGKGKDCGHCGAWLSREEN
mgnify:CR=1 FL=1